MVRRAIASIHPDHDGAPPIDFSEFWEGAPAQLSGNGNNSWGGAFRGRPVLADELWPHLQASSAYMRPEGIRGRRSQLRALFRFFDGYEHLFGDAIDRLSDVKDVHGILWQKPPNDATWGPVNGNVYSEVKRLVSLAKADAGAPFWWPSSGRAVLRPDSPDAQHVRALLHGLKREAQGIFARWQRADEAAATGNSLVGVAGKRLRGTPVSDADCHRTYRDVVAASGEPLPSQRQLAEALGFKNIPDWWPTTFKDLVAGLYPTSADLAIFASLFMARSGWNPSTVLALDITDDDWAILHGSDRNALRWIQSFKVRSNAWQDTLSPERLTTGCYNIIKQLIERTSALRSVIDRDSGRCRLPAIALRSPWLAATAGDDSVFVLTRPETINITLRAIVKSVNDRNAEIAERSGRTSDRDRAAFVIPGNFTSSDFRDGFAAFVFQNSRYSWALTQWSLNHKYPSTTRRYLRSRAWQNHTREALRRFGTVLFDEIEVHRRVDPTVLRALASGHEVSPAQVASLDDYRSRSYVGMACADPRRPDQHIDPTHPKDGTTLCINGHRCASCSQGVVLNDSLTHLAKRVAELVWLKRHASLAEWSDSSHEADLLVLQATLRQWPTGEVDPHITHWAGEIESGRHRVLRFAGER